MLILGSLSYAAEPAPTDSVAQEVMSEVKNIEAEYQALMQKEAERKEEFKQEKETLEKYGAVSEEVAREMLAGLKTDIGISTTGIAGPGGGSKDKPVGLVYIGIKVKDEVKVFKRELKGDRNKIRQRAMMHALYNLLKILK